MDRPNVLLICTDHWPGRMIGALGHPTILSPTLDEFIANGVVFTNAYAKTPMCIPARRELMTGTSSRTHGDRIFASLPMPDLPTLAQTFRDAGYQAYAVGKLHVYPPRDRIGFDDVMLNHEGGLHTSDGTVDDYELFLTEQGYSGQQFVHGMGNNVPITRPWHLPEHCHPTNWTVREMCRFIVRRDPTRPAFWYMSFNHPHPPLTPLADYMDMYRQIEVDMPYTADWARRTEELPYTMRTRRRSHTTSTYPEASVRMARQAFYALSTHIDHQIRLVIGTLREEGLIDNTVILFTSDHADMRGNHGQFAKGLFYEDSAKIPMVLVPTAEFPQSGLHRADDRLASHADIMPTLLELCGIQVPDTVEGLSLLGEERHDYLYGEIYEDSRATRMIHDGHNKLIYYPVGNRSQLFDLSDDPNEMRDLADDPGLLGYPQAAHGTCSSGTYTAATCSGWTVIGSSGCLSLKGSLGDLLRGTSATSGDGDSARISV